LGTDVLRLAKTSMTATTTRGGGAFGFAVGRSLFGSLNQDSNSIDVFTVLLVVV
jgi:hypothetical protein